MIKLEVYIFEVDGVFHAQTDFDIDPAEMIKGQGKTPLEALGKWLEDLEEREFFRPD